MFEEFRDQQLRQAIEQTAAELEAKIRDQLPLGARVAYVWDEAHDIPADAWERASRRWIDDPLGTDVVEGECVDVTEQRALPTSSQVDADGRQPAGR